MNVVHGMTRAQLDDLAPTVGRFVAHFDSLDFVLPAWWHLAYVTARE